MITIVDNKKNFLDAKDLQVNHVYKTVESIGSSIKIGDIVVMTRYGSQIIGTDLNTGHSYNLSNGSNKFEEVSLEITVKDM